MAASKKKKMKGAGGKTRDVLCVGSKVKAYVKAKGMRCSGETVGALSDCIYGILDGAIGRCKGNGRSTVRPHDL
jgi:hypothetical protein